MQAKRPKVERQQEILQAELDSVEENLEVLRAQGKEVSKKMLRGLEKRKFFDERSGKPITTLKRSWRRLPIR